MTLKDFIVFVIVGAGVGGFVHNNTVAVTQWLRQAFLKLTGWTKRETALGIADIEKLFQKHTDTIVAVVKQVPAVTIQHAQAAAAQAVITPITPQEYVAACLKASADTAGFVCGASWNQMEYLRQLDAKTFAAWCATLAALPECAGTGATAGWIQNLSQQGQGIVLTLATQGLVLPAVDPRA